MPKMHIKKAIEISASPEKVFETIGNYNTWKSWSPWLILEPEASVNVADDGKSYSWEGKKVGSGEMKITGEEPGKKLDMDLTFLKPWKSKAKVWFELEETKDASTTNLSWFMESSMPFFMFWMVKSMSAYIGMDYERGLNMLKDYIETGSVPTKLSLEGIKNYPGCKYVGIRKSCPIDQVSNEMSKDFEKLTKWIHENTENIADVPFSIYHKWDLVKGQVDYTSGIPVKEIPSNISGGFISGQIPGTKVYSISHSGPYKHLGNAWSAGYNLIQNKEFKSNKKIPPFEMYPKDPSTTAENDLITIIHFPTK